VTISLLNIPQNGANKMPTSSEAVLIVCNDTEIEIEARFNFYVDSDDASNGNEKSPVFEDIELYRDGQRIDGWLEDLVEDDIRAQLLEIHNEH